MIGDVIRGKDGNEIKVTSVSSDSFSVTSNQEPLRGLDRFACWFNNQDVGRWRCGRKNGKRRFFRA